jgi:hypothetical protein
MNLLLTYKKTNMKTSKIIFLLLITVLIINGCKKAEHSVRIKNEFPDPIVSIYFAEKDFGTIDAGTTSPYRSIEEGTHKLAGSTSSHISFENTFEISGKGEHLWTITISSTGASSIYED